MKAQSLFIIILKVAGILMIKDLILAVFPVLDALTALLSPHWEGYFYMLAYTLAALGFQGLIIYFLLFKTPVLVKALRLTRDLEEDVLQFSLHRSAVYTIAFIVSGIVLLVMYIPGLIKEIQTWLEHVSNRYGLMASRPYEYHNLFFAIARVLTGVLLIVYHPALTRFIDSRRRAAVIRDSNSGENE